MADGLFSEQIPTLTPNIAEAVLEDPIQFEEPVATLEEGVARLKLVLEENERLATAEAMAAEWASLEPAWQARLARDEASTKRTMNEELYRLAISNWKARLNRATSVHDATLEADAKRALEYFEESLKVLERYQKIKATIEKPPAEHRDLFETSVRQPEAFRAFVFAEALEKWKLNDGVRDYAEAVIELEQAKDEYVAAQADWYRERSGAAYDELKQQQHAFAEAYDACEAWQTAVSVPWATQDDWKKLSHSTCTRSKTGLFGTYTSHEPLDEAVVGQKEAEFRELYGDLFEKRNIVDAGLDGPCASLVERAGHDSVLWAELSRQSAFYTSKGEFTLTADKLKEQVLRSGARWYLADLLSQMDEPLKTAISASRAVREEIQEARQTMSRGMTKQLDLEREMLVEAGKALERFESVAREDALSAFKQAILQQEREVARALEKDPAQINIFLQRLKFATFETVRLAEARMPSVDTTELFTKHLEEVGRNPAKPDLQIDSAREVSQLNERQVGLMRLEGYVEGILEELDQPEHSGPLAIAKILTRAEQMLFSQSPIDRTWNDPAKLLSYRGISKALESPLASFADRSLFREPYDRLNSQILTTTLAEGVKKSGKLIKQLIERIENLEDAELRKLGPQLRVKYGALLG